jgi:hypothetical protein
VGGSGSTPSPAKKKKKKKTRRGSDGGGGRRGEGGVGDEDTRWLLNFHSGEVLRCSVDRPQITTQQ